MKTRKIASLALGSAFAATLLTPLAQAADSPFAAKPLQGGYQLAQADKKADGKCGEAKCGAERKMEKKADASCGSKKGEGSCGGKKAEASCGGKKADAKCGADKPAAAKKKDGKCGEAKCGASK